MSAPEEYAQRSRVVALAARTITAAWARHPVQHLADLAAQALEDACLLSSPEIAAELERLRQERDAFADRVDTLTAVAKGNKRHVRELYGELQKALARVAELEPYEALNPQQCPKGIHADWLVDSEYAHRCPWCRVAELEAERHATNDALAEVTAASRATETERDQLKQRVATIQAFADSISGDARDLWTLGYRACRNDLREVLRRHALVGNARVDASVDRLRGVLAPTQDGGESS